jgi:RNA-directed DNA polymerase
MEGTTSDGQAQFVHAIQKCWDEKSYKFRNLYKIIFTEETLRMAYKEVLAKKRASILKDDEMHLNTFKNISDRLFRSCYKFGVSKKVLVSKRNAAEKRSFTMMSPWDKVVVHSIYMVLRHVYENFDNNMLLKNYKNNKKAKKQEGAKSSFLNVSHAFRLGKSCHTVLNDIQSWGLCNWFIKIDIRNFFDGVNQKRLLNILRETIDDEPVIGLIKQLFNINVLHNEFKSDGEEGVGVPQGSFLSNFLGNIYLHKLDEFILKKQDEIWNKNDIKKCSVIQTKE